MAIDWNHWLKCRTLHEIEVVLLTLGFDPESHQIDYLDGHYLATESELKQKQKEFIRRMGIVQDYRFKSYDYMTNDGEWGDYFAKDFNNRVLVKRFLLWLKNENFGWNLPKELQAYIEKLNTPNESHWAQELVDNLNNKLTQPKVTQSGMMKPEGWKPLAEGYARDIFKFNPQISLETISTEIAEKFERQGILSVRGIPIKANTISRHLSKWKFNLERIKANKK